MNIMKTCWDRSSQGLTGQGKLGQVKSKLVKSGLVKSGQDWSSQFGSSQKKSGQVKTSYNRSSQVMTGQVKLGMIKSDRSSRKFFRPKFFLDPNVSWSKIFVDPKFFRTQIVFSLLVSQNLWLTISSVQNSLKLNFFLSERFWIPDFFALKILVQEIK